MNKNIKMYFDAHAGKDTLHFTKDGQCFFNKADASAHSQALEKKEKGTGTITEVNCAEVAAWWKTEAPKLAVAAEEAVVAAEKAEQAAQAAVVALGKDATPSKRLAVNGALLKATAELAKANKALELAQADLSLTLSTSIY